ncbi:MAG: hypothetical protein RJA81_532 [Planctomycetota bacterium]
MKVEPIDIRSILTRSSGYLQSVCSHSLQPYRGCGLGQSLCGVGCYARHQQFLVKGREWGRFLDYKPNAAEIYCKTFDAEKNWARRTHGHMAIFCSSSTEPFPPQEKQLGITQACLAAMLEKPPDSLILQTHSHFVADHLALLSELDKKCRLRIQISIETDRATMPELPGHFSSIDRRINACEILHRSGLNVVVTVSPLLPIKNPDCFFRTLSQVAGAIVIDHYIGGDGSKNGSRTLKTPLPSSMKAVEPTSVSLSYRDKMACIAHQYLPGKVGLGIEGFAGRYLFQPDKND